MEMLKKHRKLIILHTINTDPVAQFLLKNCSLFEYIEYISVCACILLCV